jgi:hypothetical protein
VKFCGLVLWVKCKPSRRLTFCWRGVFFPPRGPDWTTIMMYFKDEVAGERDARIDVWCSALP